MNKPLFESGVAHYDDPPPDVIDDLDALRDNDGFRFANRLHAWIDVEDGRIVGAGYGDDSGGIMGSTTVRFATKEATFAAPSLPRNSARPGNRADRRRDSCRRSADVPRCRRPDA